MQMQAAIPALPVRNVELSIPFYRDILGLTMRHHDRGFAIFHQDTVEIHLWQADDESPCVLICSETDAVPRSVSNRASGVENDDLNHTDDTPELDRC